MKAIIAVPATALLCYRAYSKKSLTPAGIVTAALTATAHAVHPWNLPFILLVVFFLAGTRVTHVNEKIKASLTLQSKGSSGGEGPRTHIQVLANSLVASFLSLLHAYTLRERQRTMLADPAAAATGNLGSLCYSWGGDLAIIGLVANYACVSADTFSSELGILAKSQPRLITSWNLRKVPRGTNGGVTLLGLGAGLMGSMVVVVAAVLFMPFCSDATAGKFGGGPAWTDEQRRILILGLTVWGLLGSVLDSILGGLFQRTVKDVRSGKIVEGEGGIRVLVSTDAQSYSAELHDKRANAKVAALSGEGKDALEKRQEEPVVVETAADVSPNRFDAKDKQWRSSFGDDRPSRVVENGWDLLDNNDVNFLMAFMMSLGAMAVAGWYWGVPLHSIFPNAITPAASAST